MEPMVRPKEDVSEHKEERIKPHKQITHDKHGQRIAYAGEEEQTLDDLVREEKTTTSSFDRDIAHQISKDHTFKEGLDYMDESSDRLSRKKQKAQDRKQKQALNGLLFSNVEYKRKEDRIAECEYCYHESQTPKVNVIALGTKTYLALPETVDMVPLHCIIVPIQHCATTLECERLFSVLC